MKTLKSILLLVSFLALGACEDYFDVNEDPNRTSDAPVDLVLPAAQASTSIVLGGTYYNLGGYWSQYYTQSPEAGQYENIDSYNITADFYDGSWSELYAGALSDYAVVKEKSLEEGNNAYYLVATLMEAYTYQILADLYGQVPYSEAIEGVENKAPVYDDGREIYNSLLVEIDNAMQRFEENPSGPYPGSDDLIFGGDMDAWLNFGNTLKLKLLMRGSFVNGFQNPSAIMNLVNSGNLLNQHAVMDNFTSQQNKQNPFYDVNVARLGGVNHVASATLVEFLTINNDPRLSEIYRPGDDGNFTGKIQGTFETRNVSFDDLAKPVFTPTRPVYLFSVPEVKFLQAEAALRFGGGNAQQYYEEGVMAAFDLWGVTPNDTLIGPGDPYEYNLMGSQEEQLEQIMTQKWAALASIQNLEAFFELTRTGYPQYTTLSNFAPGNLVYSQASVLPEGTAPKRLLFPDISRERNPNVPPQPQGEIAAPVWWDVN